MNWNISYENNKRIIEGIFQTREQAWDHIKNTILKRIERYITEKTSMCLDDFVDSLEENQSIIELIKEKHTNLIPVLKIDEKRQKMEAFMKHSGNIWSSNYAILDCEILQITKIEEEKNENDNHKGELILISSLKKQVEDLEYDKTLLKEKIAELESTLVLKNMSSEKSTTTTSLANETKKKVFVNRESELAAVLSNKELILEFQKKLSEKFDTKDT